MISSAKIKWIKSLSQKKIRWQEGFFVAEGEKIVDELIHSNWHVTDIYSTDTTAERAALARGIPFHLIRDGELDRISLLTTPNKSLAVVKIPKQEENVYPAKGEFTLLLDNTQDPGNMGTIIRTAEWFGIKTIICSHNTVDVYNPKVIQSTMGSFIRTKVVYADPEQVLSDLDGSLPVMGALLDGEDLYQTTLPEEGILIIGNESKGISAQLTRFVTKKLFIPRGRNNTSAAHPESLNASVAAAIIMAQLSK